ncbi:MAG: T9SS type A sorting domain-containing protein [bacterium]|nr:T9SS type A sorting domain-containing protein [bacterium]
MKKILFHLLFLSVLSGINYAQNFDWLWQNPLPTGADHNDAVILSANKFLLFGNGSAVSLSTDAGNTWSISYFDPQARDIYDVIFPDQNTGYAVGTLGLIMKTTDGGENWVVQNSGLTTTLWDVDFINTNVGYAVGNSGNILKTTDGGTNWSISTYGTTAIYKVHYVNDTLIFLGSASSTTGRLLRSTNGGSSWDNITANITGLDGTVRGLHFFDADTGWISNSTGKIFKTTNGGASGGIIYDIGSSTTIYEVKFLDASDGYALTTAGRVLKTTNGGTSWDLIQTDANENLFGLGILGVNSEAATPVLIGGDVGQIVVSLDDGATWQRKNTSLTNEILHRLSFPTESTGYVVGGSITTGNSYGDILKTTDSGVTWTNLTFDPGYRTYSVFFLDENTGYIGTQGPTGVYKTTNGGADWAQLNTGTGTASNIVYDIKFYDQNLGFAMYSSGQVARTTNAGVNWTPVSAGWGSAAGYEIFIVDSNIIYLCGGGNRFSKSTNGGVSFTQIGSLGTVTFYSMHFFDENNGFIAGSGGKLFKTTNGGTNFTEIQMPTTATLYTIRFLTNDFGLMAGASGFAYYTTDGGTNWTPTQMYLGTTQTIRDIRFAGTKVWAVGTDGTILSGNVGNSSTFQLSVNVADGWNMVSIPGLHPVDQNVGTWWAYRVAGSQVFKYQGGYTQVTTATPGEGYWMKQDGARVYNTGDEWPSGGIQIVPHAPLAGNSGWNMIGGYELSVTAANVTTVPGGLQSGPIFKYSGGYTAATTIDPGYGYWIKLTGAGQIIIPETMAKRSITEYFPEDWGKIIISDATGSNYTLYSVKGKVDLSQYDLPPTPPAGMFDIRFNSGRIAEDINSSIKAIDMSGVTYPLTVRVEGMNIRLMDESGKMVNVNLKDGEDVLIDNFTINKLIVSGEMLPTIYSLEQNYPNPFNPSTVIEFSLPEDVSNVKLTIYNMLGEKVTDIVNTSLKAGKYQYQWNAKNVATGMYIYELRTDKFVSVKKMLLLK